MDDRYLLTAQMDTGEEYSQDVFSQLDKRDPRRIFRRLDPNQYYPVYGDGSQTTVDIDSQGKFYLRLQDGGSEGPLGQLRHQLLRRPAGPGEPRPLRGPAALGRPDGGPLGGRKAEATLFGAEALNAHARDELRATGGSLYYLSHGQVSSGKPDPAGGSARPSQRPGGHQIPLIEGQDYTMDWVSGRIILTRSPWPPSWRASRSSPAPQQRPAGLPGDRLRI